MKNFFAIMNDNFPPFKKRFLDNNAKYITINQNVLFHYDSSKNEECFQNNINTINILFQGEIYNKNELFSMLQITPTTYTESEIIYHLYEKYGLKKTLGLLDGVFTFVLYDSNLHNEDASFTQKMYVARDSLGIRPFYMFTKEINLTQREKRTIIGFGKNISCFSHYFEEEKDDYEIAEFPPGTFSKYELSFKTFSDWKLVSKNNSFYTPPTMFTTTAKYDMDNMEWYIQGIKIYLQEAIKKRCQYVFDAGFHPGCLLSGGFKSSLIAALVNKEFSARGIQLETFTIGFKDSDHLKEAKQTADFLGTLHHEIIVEESELFDSIKDVISVVETFDKKTVRDSIGNYLIGKWIKENTNIKFLFNGDGGDALCGGYPYMSGIERQIDFEIETRRLLKLIPTTDLIRSDKCLSSNNIKSMVPFLDVFFVNFYLSIPLHIRSQNTLGKNCHYLLRHSFSGEELLPRNILQREKRKTTWDWFDYNEIILEMIEKNKKTYDFLFIDKKEEEKQDENIDLEDKLYRYYYHSLFLPDVYGKDT